MNFFFIYSLIEDSIRNKEKPSIDMLKYYGANAFQLLIATMLSARTKDELTLEISRNLFKHVKKAEDVLKYNEEELSKMLYPIGFYKTKARNLIALSKILIEKYNGKVPSSKKELMSLPGIGLKTANLVLAVAFSKDEICVDTHVHRIFNRFLRINTKTPEETEKKLRDILPKELWKKTNYLFVPFGRNICKPIKPLCNICPINQYCKFYEEVKK